MFLAALLVVILATFLRLTYLEVEKTLMRAGRERAQAAADQLAEMLQRSVRTALEEHDRLRSHAAVRAYLRSPTAEARQAALEALEPRTPQAPRRIELWNAAGARIVEMATPGKSLAGEAQVNYPAGPPPRQPGISALQAAGELAYFELVGEIRDGSSPRDPLLGYLRRYGRLTTSPGGTVRRLVGGEAVIKIGSTPGAWTNFLTPVEAPPANVTRADLGEYRADNGQRWVGAAAGIDGTPWQVWVGFPQAVIVAPAQEFMQRMSMLALVFVAFSVALVAILGVRLTQPLHKLASAAEDIAAGDYTRRVPARGEDEIGRLSAAFNAMTNRIEEVHESLRASHEQIQFALAAARIAVWECHLATGRMTCSDTIRLVHGVSEEALPKTCEEFIDLVHPDDRDSMRRVFEPQQRDGGLFEVQYRALHPDGSVRWIEGKGRRRLDTEGRGVSVLGVSIDVTEQRRLESQLRQAQKMEAIGQLAGGVAHDFNNLLTAIIGHGDMILEELSEADPRRENMVEILKAGERAAALTRQLLAFSRQQVMQPEVLAVNDVIANVEKLMRRLIGERITIVTDLAPDVDAVKVDPGQLEQVLVNLAVNARDAMPDGGTLTIATANAELSADYAEHHPSVTPGRYVVLSVSDTGIGMDAETQAHLFEPFFTTKAPGKGTGLGLATVYGIVKQSGGHIYVYSERGHGATFKIYLPSTAEKAAPGTVKSAPPKAAGGSETILIVEDNAQVQTIARRILEQLGYRVMLASSGEEALQIVEGTGARLDLVISDVIMPGMTGPDLCRQLARRYPQLRVLFTSGYSSDAISRYGVLEPGTLFIEKPYTAVALARKVREALEQDR